MPALHAQWTTNHWSCWSVYDQITKAVEDNPLLVVKQLLNELAKIWNTKENSNVSCMYNNFGFRKLNVDRKRLFSVTRQHNSFIFSTMKLCITTAYLNQNAMQSQSKRISWMPLPVLHHMRGVAQNNYATSNIVLPYAAYFLRHALPRLRLRYTLPRRHSSLKYQEYLRYVCEHVRVQ